MLRMICKLNLGLVLLLTALNSFSGVVMLLRDGRMVSRIPERNMTYADLRRFLESGFDLDAGSIKALVLPDGDRIESALLESEEQVLDESHFNKLAAGAGVSILII